MQKNFIVRLKKLGLWTPDHKKVYSFLKPFLKDKGIMQVIDPYHNQAELEPQQAENNFDKLKLLTTPLSNGNIPIYLLGQLLSTEEILSILKKDVFKEIINFLELFSHDSYNYFLISKTRQKHFKEFVLAVMAREIPNAVEFLKLIIYNLKLFGIEITPFDFRKIASEYDPAANYNISNKKTFLEFLNSFNIRPVVTGVRVVPGQPANSPSLSANPATGYASGSTDTHKDATLGSPFNFFGLGPKRARVEQAKIISREDAIQNIIKTQSDLQSKLSSNFLIDIGVYNDSEHDLIVMQMQLLNRISSLATDSPEFKTLLKEYHANVKEQQYHKIWRVLTPEEQNIQKLEDLVKELDTGSTPSTQYPK